MHVRVMEEGLTPGMKNGQEPNLSPEMLWIGSDLLQGLGDGAKENVVDHPLVLERELLELIGDGKDDMEVRNGEKLVPTRVQPFCARGCEALWTVPVPTRVVENLQVPALIALPDMPAQSRGATLRHGAKHPPLR